ncbi:hypothetical protein, partial [Corallococcus sp. 4LFB]|uniref:hypothetical protein n=1 Tax=Corallococcus sp. 4LFB TaxID=3383249 RepID=UPI003975FCE4
RRRAPGARPEWRSAERTEPDARRASKTIGPVPSPTSPPPRHRNPGRPRRPSILWFDALSREDVAQAGGKAPTWES